MLYQDSERVLVCAFAHSSFILPVSPSRSHNFTVPIHGYCRYLLGYLIAIPSLALSLLLISPLHILITSYSLKLAFFTFLRANLAIPPCDSISSLSTPSLEPCSSHHLPPLGPSSLATMTSIDSCDDVSTTSSSLHSPSSSLSSTDSIRSFPSSATSYSSEYGWYGRGEGEVMTEVLWRVKDKQAALDLVKDSIKEQKETSFNSVITHPLIAMWWVLLISVLWKVGNQTGSGMKLSVAAVIAVTASCLALLWRLVGEYDSHSRIIDESWVAESDIIVGAFLGNELAGTAILRVERSNNKENKRRKIDGKALVKAWTTKKTHRKKGVGKALLEEVVRVAREKMRNSAEIGFAVDHAHCRVVLPELFNRGFRKDERKAAMALEGIVGMKNTDVKRPGRRRGRW